MDRLSIAAIAFGVALSGFGFPSRAPATVMSNVIETGGFGVSGRNRGKPKETVPAVGLGIEPGHQAASFFVSSHRSKNVEGASPPSDPWGRSTLYS